MHERVYVGGRLEGYVNVSDVDAPKYASYPDDRYTQMEQRHLVVAELVFHPSGARVRESLSYDLPLLWPLDYARAVGRFKFAPREDRLRYLARVGTRFVILPTPPFPGATPLARLAGVEQLQLYDFNPGARRTYIVPDALMGPDVEWQLEGLFQPRFDPSRGVLVSERPPPPAGMPGPAVAASATFLEDGLNRVVIRAGLPADGYLALLDTYTPDWAVDVDGAPAPLMRANGLFRAVHLTPGTHVVTFTYRPSKFYLGASISAVTALLLLCVVCGRGGAAKRRMSGCRQAPNRRAPAPGKRAMRSVGLFSSSPSASPRRSASSRHTAFSSSATCRSSSGRVTSGCGTRSSAARRRGGIRTSRAGSRRSPTRSTSC